MFSPTLARRLSRFESIGDVTTFLAMALWIAVLPLLLRTVSLPRLLEMLTPNTAREPADSVAPEKLDRYVGWLLRTGIGAYQPNCLKRTLVLYRFLRKAGHDVTFCLGVRKHGATETRSSTPSLSGHAWLTRAGHAFLEPNTHGLDAFKVTFRFPSTSG